MRDITVTTKRLCLAPQTIAALTELCRNETDAEMKKAYQEMIETMRQLPGREEWGSDWSIRLTDGPVIGGIGFKGAPDAGGVIEIGYGIDDAYRRQGYATEAVAGMVKWALHRAAFPALPHKQNRKMPSPKRCCCTTALCATATARKVRFTKSPQHKIWRRKRPAHGEPKPEQGAFFF